jgi:hypothetical protein
VSILCRSAIFPDLMVIFPCRDLVSASHAPHNNNNNNNMFWAVFTLGLAKAARKRWQIIFPQSSFFTV